MEHYEKLRVVGRGAFGTCWLCKERNNPYGEKVIIKTIQMNGLTTKEEENIKGEANLLQKMQHPMIIGYKDYFMKHENSEIEMHIVMQYAEGGTLDNLLRDQKGVMLEEETVLNYFTQILLGLDYMHSLHILHRDLKTQNILLNRKRTLIKLSDFGISKDLSARTGGVASTVVGTPNYMSPEICEGRPYNQKSDIWALGCVLYEMFMLRRAFDGENMPAIIMKITQQRYEPLGKHVGKPSVEFVHLLLSRNESKRPVVKEMLTCPLILPHTLTVVLDLGRITPYTKRDKTARSPYISAHRARQSSDSVLSRTHLASNSSSFSTVSSQSRLYDSTR